MRRTAWFSMLMTLAPGWAAAEVVDSASNGFTVRTTLSIQATPQEVYKQIMLIGDWWDPAHTFSGNANNLSVEERAMGCFCENLGGGGVVRHMQVVYLAPGKKLVMTGGLGPLQSMAATGSMSIQITPAEGGAKLEMTYAVTGYLPAGMNTLAAPVDAVLHEQFTRLKNLIEHGDPAPKS